MILPITAHEVKINISSAKSGIGNAIENKTSNRNFALFLTWIIMGFWHGANWNFAFWGLLHATFIFLERKIITFFIKNADLFYVN